MISNFQYDIRNEEVAQALVEQGFEVYNTIPGCWTMQAPENISTTKARKIISTIIKLYTTAKELNRAQQKYDYLVDQLERLHISN